MSIGDKEISKKPRLRFKGFTEDWEQRKLKEISNIQAGGDVDNSKIKESGKYPVIANALTNDGIVGYYDEDYRITAPAVTVTGRGDVGHSQARKVDFTPVVRLLALNTKHDVDFISNAINTKRIIVESTGVPQLTVPQLENYEIYTTSEIEESEVGRLFLKLDNLITLHQSKLDKISDMKKSLLEKMFPQNNSNIPALRFKKFNDAWEQRKLGEMMNVTSVKRIHQSDWQKSGVRFLRARDIVSEFKNEEPDEYLYISKDKYEEYSKISGKVIENDLLVTGVGTIGVPYLVRDSKPIYFKDGNIIWFKNNNKIFGKFLYYSFTSNIIQSFINESAGTGTVGTYTIESGKNTPILLPSKEEQKQIGKLFYNLDNLITLHQSKLKNLKNMKKCLLEKMFV